MQHAAPEKPEQKPAKRPFAWGPRGNEWHFHLDHDGRVLKDYEPRHGAHRGPSCSGCA